MSVEFEPTRLGRRRRLDPLLLGAIGVVIAVLAAVAKPWGAPDGDGDRGAASPATASPIAAAVPSASPPVSSTTTHPGGSQTRSASVPDWSDIGRAVRRHESWGIRVILRAPASDGPPTRIVERWFGLPSGDGEPPAVAVDVGRVPILALGVTFPTAQLPLDVRVWRIGPADPEWLDIQAIDSVPSGGGFLYVRAGPPGRPPLSGRQAQAWTPGTYRVDALVDGGIRTITVRIADPDSDVPTRDVATAPAPTAAEPLVEPADSELPDIAIGAFATVDGASVAFDAIEGPPLDGPGAWLNVDPGTGRAPRSFVASAYLPGATGLGVMLPPGSVVRTASLERLAPGPLAAPLDPLDPKTGYAERQDVVLFGPPSGGAWPAGVYRIDVDWADRDGIHARSWHVELRPGPVRMPSSLLAAAREWARYAGTSGVLLATAAAPIRPLPLEPEAAAYPVPAGAAGCGGTVVRGRPEILGFAYPADRDLMTASGRILLPFLRRDDQVMLTAAFGVRGLILVAPGRSRSLPAATYRFRVGEGEDAVDYTLCLGMRLFDD